MSLENSHRITQSSQIVGTGHPCWARTYYSYLVIMYSICLSADLSVTAKFYCKPFQCTNSNRLVHLATSTSMLTGMSTNISTNGGKRITISYYLQGFHNPSLGNQINILTYLHMQRAGTWAWR